MRWQITKSKPSFAGNQWVERIESFILHSFRRNERKFSQVLCLLFCSFGGLTLLAGESNRQQIPTACELRVRTKWRQMNSRNKKKTHTQNFMGEVRGGTAKKILNESEMKRLKTIDIMQLFRILMCDCVRTLIFDSMIMVTTMYLCAHLFLANPFLSVCLRWMHVFHYSLCLFLILMAMIDSRCISASIP